MGQRPITTALDAMPPIIILSTAIFGLRTNEPHFGSRWVEKATIDLNRVGLVPNFGGGTCGRRGCRDGGRQNQSDNSLSKLPRARRQQHFSNVSSPEWSAGGLYCRPTKEVSEPQP